MSGRPGRWLLLLWLGGCAHGAVEADREQRAPVPRPDCWAGQYRYHLVGMFESFSCVPLPEECRAEPTCACLGPHLRQDVSCSEAPLEALEHGRVLH